jgi:hypothetical protein
MQYFRTGEGDALPSPMAASRKENQPGGVPSFAQPGEPAPLLLAGGM